MVKCTEYHPDNGYKLLVLDTWRDGERKNLTKELYDKSWRLIKSKAYEFVNGKKKEI